MHPTAKTGGPGSSTYRARRLAYLRHYGEYRRDVPQSCLCQWAWSAAGHRFVIAVRCTLCIWHREQAMT